MEERILIGVIVFLFSLIGFFFKMLVKTLEETKEALNKLNNSLTQHITKQEYIEKQVFQNESEILQMRESLHDLGNSINQFNLKVEMMETSKK